MFEIQRVKWKFIFASRISSNFFQTKVFSYKLCSCCVVRGDTFSVAWKIFVAQLYNDWFHWDNKYSKDAG